MVGVKAIELNSIEKVVVESENLKISEDRRSFAYNLNDKNAKAKLLKGAKREAFEIENNQSSCNLVFNPGSWNYLVQPTVQYWGNVKANKTCKLGEIEVQMASVKTGRDIVGKHIDTQVVFFVNREKAVCHLYNTTQKILVNGHGYKNLLEHFLKPYFESKLPMYEKEVEVYNNLVLETLGSRKVKRGDIRYKRGSTFPCDKCDFKSATKQSLRLHKHAKHDGLRYPCGECNHQATQKQSLKSHMSSKHGGEQFQCDDCDYKSATNQSLKYHIVSKHGGERILCPKTTSQITLGI